MVLYQDPEEEGAVKGGYWLPNKLSRLSLTDVHQVNLVTGLCLLGNPGKDPVNPGHKVVYIYSRGSRVYLPIKGAGLHFNGS